MSLTIARQFRRSLRHCNQSGLCADGNGALFKQQAKRRRMRCGNRTATCLDGTTPQAPMSGYCSYSSTLLAICQQDYVQQAHPEFFGAKCRAFDATVHCRAHPPDRTVPIYPAQAQQSQDDTGGIGDFPSLDRQEEVSANPTGHAENAICLLLTGRSKSRAHPVQRTRRACSNK